MWKLVIVFAIVLIALVPYAVEAATSIDVTITAIGVVIAPPSGFTVSYVSDYETSLSWTNPPGSMATMVRAAYGHAPTSMTDGYLVYQGAGNSFNDTSASLTSPDIIYYRAWEQRASDGQWGALYAADDTEDIMSLSFMFVGIIVLMLMAAGLAVSAFFSKRKLLAALAGLLFITVVGGVVATPNFPMATLIIMFALISATAMFLSPVYFRIPKEQPKPSMSHSDHLYNEVERVRKLRGKHSLQNKKGLFD